MKKTMLFSAVAVASLAAFAAPRMNKNHVPEKIDESIRSFKPAAAERPHILLVNVGKAVPDEDWSLSATYAASRLQLNIWTNSIDVVSAPGLVEDPSLTEKLFMNPNAKVGVYFVNKKGASPVVASPGRWAVVNVAMASEGSPDKQTYRDRVAKIVLKGIAAASGGGATVEPMCSMFYRSNTLAGLDAVNIMLTPMCYFPMLEILREVGGPDMTFPAN